MKSIFRSSRRKNPHQNEEKKQQEAPFFAKENKTPFFNGSQGAAVQPKLTVGQPGDKYEQEADQVADAVVNNGTSKSAIQSKEISNIQRVSLATPQEDEKLGTAEQRMEEDKLVQEKPELQKMEEPEEEEGMVSKMAGEKEEEGTINKQEATPEDEEPAIQGKEELPEEEGMVNKMEGGQEEEEMVNKQEAAPVEEEEPAIQSKEEQPEEEGMVSKMEGEEEEEPAIQGKEEMPEEEGMVNKMDAEQEEEKPVQTKSNGNSQTASTGVSQQLKSKAGRGKSLPKSTKAEMESSFERDLGGVNIHTDTDAINMNKELGAQAFTHGQDVYFNSGKYDPDSTEGKHLLAHELTHVVQQNSGQLNRTQQKKKPSLIQQLSCGTSEKDVGRRDTKKKNPLDKRATAILAIASDDTKPNTEKGVEIVSQIICQYFPQQASLVNKVVYKADLNGLDTTSKGKGKSTTGIIGVGDYFTKATTKRALARRVTQVWHEIRHIQQYRKGLSGSNNQDEREFLAYSENAISAEFLGTGSINYSTRYSLIDAALKHFYCMPKEKQKTYSEREKNLLSLRKAIEKSKRLKAKKTVPATCK